MTTPPPLTVKNSGMATASLVLGILSLVLMIICIGPLFAIPAVILGHIALSRIRKSGGMIGGGGLAIGGLVTGYISLALIPLLAAIALPNFVKARDTAQKNACINNLRVIDGAKQQWALENSKPADAVPTAADLDRYIPGGYAHLHCPRDGEYVIGQVDEAATCSIPGHDFSHSYSYAPANVQPSHRPPFYRRPSNITPTHSTTSNQQSPETVKTEQCKANLRTIASAKRLWQMRFHKQTGDVPSETDLASCLPSGKMPTCPDSGTYEIGALGENPTCSMPGHELPQNP